MAKPADARQQDLATEEIIAKGEEIIHGGQEIVAAGQDVVAAAKNSEGYDAGAKADELPGPLAKIDEFQQKHAFLGLPIAVYKKFSDDEAGKLAALISYYAFLSIFPLLIVFATVLSHVLVNHQELANEIVTTAAGSFLQIGATGTVEPLNLSGFALVIAVVIALWSGLAVANHMQDSMNVVYEVPKTARPGFIWKLLRSITLLIIVGVGLPATTLLLGYVSKAIGGLGATVGVTLGSVILNSLLIALAFRRSTVATTSWRDVMPGAVIAGIAWSAMQVFATFLLTNKVSGSQATYGSFAIVIGLLFWFFLLAQITLYCAELNVVLQHKLWPRGLKSIIKGTSDTEADERVYSAYPGREQQVKNVEVSVDVRDDAPQPSKNALAKPD